MKRARILVAVFLLLVGVVVPMLSTHHASAFNNNDVMDDAIFNDVYSMSASSIDNFLNTFPSSCISTNHGFSAPDPNGYSPQTGFTYGGHVSAGQVIYNVANAYGINPQALLATMQKEQSIVSGAGGCAGTVYAGAMGYGCPDSGTTHSYSGIDMGSINGNMMNSVSNTCVNTQAKVGFSQQVVHGAWLLKFGEQKSEGNTGWAVINGNWNNCDDNATCPSAWGISSADACYNGPMTQGNYATCPGASTTYYDGYTTIDGTSVHMDSGATAALYWYTPHFSGNQSFDTIFTSWFGPVITAGYSYSLLGHQLYTDSSMTTLQDSSSLVAGQRYYAYVQVQNTGTATWYPGQVDLGTWAPAGRSSILKDWTWPTPNNNRTPFLQQSSVAPGATGTYGFWIVAPPTSMGWDWEHFNLVAENIGWMPDSGLYFGLKSSQNPSFSYSLLGHDLYTDPSMTSEQNSTNLTPGQRYYAVAEVQNTGNTTWYQNEVQTGTWNPTDRASIVKDWTWPSTQNNRAGTFYNAATVAPGGTAWFGFWIVAPQANSNIDWENFTLVNQNSQGTSWMSPQGIVYGLKS